MWIREGETRSIPGAEGYYLENKQFILENYTKDEADEVFGDALERVGPIVKNYQTDVSLYKDPEGGLPGQSDKMEFVKDESIIVNKPLKFDGYNVFQMDYELNELKSMTFQLTEKATDKSLGEFTVDLMNPERMYELGDGANVELRIITLIMGVLKTENQ